MKQKAHTILDCKLIKVEKKYNQVRPGKFFYNLQLEGIDEPLLVETYHSLEMGIVGSKIKYKLNEENEVSDFEFC